MKKRTISGLVLMLAACALLLFMNRFTAGEQVITFPSVCKGKPVTLEATLWEKPGADYAVLICPGYSCDRQKWRPIANIAAGAGCTVMVFDYAGQGASSGSIGFDNARTDWISVQIDDAIGELMARTGLPEDHIILIGHSMGGRAILRLLYDYNRPGAVTTVQPRHIRSAILLSPEVNYLHSAQASLFAGTEDGLEEPWSSYSGADVQGTDLWLLGSTSDDVVSDGCLLALYARIGGAGAPDSGVYEGESVSEWGSALHVKVRGGVLHSYMMYDGGFAQDVSDALEMITGTRSAAGSAEQYLTYAGWLLALAGAALFLNGLNSGNPVPVQERLPRLTDGRRFLLRKLLLWLPGILTAVLLCSLCAVAPFGSPIMNIPYMCFIAGYGLVMLVAYRKGRFAGTEGRLSGIAVKLHGGRKDLITALAGSITVLALIWFVCRMTMYRLIPLNTRLLWLLIAGGLMTVGFHVSGTERDMLQASGAARKVIVLYELIQYIPLLLFVLFYLVIGSYSGLIGQLINVVLMYVLFVPLGRLVRSRTGSRLLGAAVTAFAFQGFMITSAALIAMF